VAGGVEDLGFTLSILADPQAGGLRRLCDPALPRGPGGLWSLAARGLEELESGRAAVVHVDAGSRTVEEPGAPVSIVKLAVYTLPPQGEPVVELPVYQEAGGGRAAAAIYARADYRVRQALTFLVEAAGLLAAARRAREEHGVGEVFALKDGPLMQHIAAYSRAEVSIPKDDLIAYLAYAGLPRGEALEIAEASTISSGMASLAAAIVEVMERIIVEARRGWLHPLGVVEDTHRSRSLILHLATHTLAEALRSASQRRGGNAPADKVAEEAAGLLADLAIMTRQEIEKRLGGTKLADCLGLSPLEVSSASVEWGRAAKPLLEDLLASLAQRGVNPSGLQGQGLVELASVLVKGQLLPPHTRDPDLVVFAYYTGVLGSVATAPLERLDLAASTLDIHPPRELEDLRRRAHEAARRIRFRYLLADPPPTCAGLAGEAGRAGVDASPYELAAGDAYAYAPPLRVESVEGDQGEPRALAIAALEAVLARYKYPQGLLIADRASRVTLQEALAARSLAERLVPLRYYIRSWEKRVELG
jgi:hypothetical protein